jgi:hypothetical protein
MWQQMRCARSSRLGPCPDIPKLVRPQVALKSTGSFTGSPHHGQLVFNLVDCVGGGTDASRGIRDHVDERMINLFFEITKIVGAGAVVTKKLRNS